MCHAFLLCLLSLWGRKKKRKQAHCHGHLTLGIFICGPLHPTSLQVKRVRKINEEDHVQHPEGSATAFCPEVSVTTVANKGLFALASSKKLILIFRTSLCTLRWKWKMINIFSVIKTCSFFSHTWNYTWNGVSLFAYFLLKYLLL